jgi:hypothetical protein
LQSTTANGDFDPPVLRAAFSRAVNGNRSASARPAASLRLADTPAALSIRMICSARCSDHIRFDAKSKLRIGTLSV